MAGKDIEVVENELEKSLERWNPFRMLEPFREFRFPWGASALPEAWMPRMDVRETDKEYIVDIALPGVHKEDVKVEAKDDILTITGEKKTEKEEKGKTWLRRESSYGAFQRSIALPEGMHPENIKASHKDGVLTLTMHKPAGAKTRGVSVKID